MKNIKYTQGFTLLELVIYLALLAVLMAGFFSAAFTLLESSSRDSTDAMLESEGGYLLAKVRFGLLQNGSQVDPAVFVSGNMSISNSGFYDVITTQDSGNFKSVGVRFTLSMRSPQGRLVSEDFFSTTTIAQ